MTPSQAKMNSGEQPQLRPDYYVANFHTLAGFVSDTYSDLLNPAEKLWYQAVVSTTNRAQRLYIRLLMRKGSTFRLRRLNYAEIDDTALAATELVEAGLALDCPNADLPTLMSCYTKPELVALLDLSPQKGLSRADLVDHICTAPEPLQRQYSETLLCANSWVTPLGHAHWMLMQLCFFGNLYQDSREFVLSELGTFRYENYPLDKSARAFTSRAQIEAHWRYYECEALLDAVNKHDASALMTFASDLPAADLHDIHLLRRVDRLRNQIARQLERLSCSDLAIELYQQSISPPARERTVRIYLQQQRWDEAASLAKAMSKKPLNEPERLTADRLLAQCAKARGQAFKKQALYKPQTSRLILRNTGERVEKQARGFYAVNGQCFHTENTLVNGVFGLFIWDILFTPLPGAFYNPFQSAPSDYKHPEFYTRRQALFEARFVQLDNKVQFGALVHQAFDAHHGKLNPLVRWRGLSQPLLSLGIDRIPAGHWRAMFNRLVLDLREHTTGLPDLVRFPDKGGYEFIEIKGPGDALQTHQRRWMRYFNEHGIPCRLVHVGYQKEGSTPRHRDENTL